MMIQFKHPVTGLIKECKVGFSWTTFFFGFFVPVARGWYGYAGIMVLVSIFTGGLSGIVYAFLINKHYVRHLIETGYRPMNEFVVGAVQQMGIAYQPSAVDAVVTKAA
jgi:hypothetical protein